MRHCACGCGRAWRPLNPRRLYHPECRAAVQNDRRGFANLTKRDIARIEAMFQAARAARRRGRDVQRDTTCRTW